MQHQVTIKAEGDFIFESVDAVPDDWVQAREESARRVDLLAKQIDRSLAQYKAREEEMKKKKRKAK